MRQKTLQWLRALLAALISGAANNVLAFLGIGAAKVLGIDVATLSYKQMWALLISGGLVGLCAYLVKSPLPPEPTGNTDIFYKKKDEGGG